MQELQERAVSSRGFSTKTRVERNTRQEFRGTQSAKTTRKSMLGYGSQNGQWMIKELLLLPRSI